MEYKEVLLFCGIAGVMALIYAVIRYLDLGTAFASILELIK